MSNATQAGMIAPSGAAGLRSRTGATRDTCCDEGPCANPCAGVTGRRIPGAVISGTFWPYNGTWPGAVQQEIAEVDHLTPGGTIEIGDKFSVTLSPMGIIEYGQTETIAATGTTVASVVAQLVAALAASTQSYFQGVTWTNGGTHVVATAKAGVWQFWCTVATVEADNSAADGQTFTVTVATPAGAMATFKGFDADGAMVISDTYTGVPDATTPWASKSEPDSRFAPTAAPGNVEQICLVAPWSNLELIVPHIPYQACATYNGMGPFCSAYIIPLADSDNVVGYRPVSRHLSGSAEDVPWASLALPYDLEVQEFDRDNPVAGVYAWGVGWGYGPNSGAPGQRIEGLPEPWPGAFWAGGFLLFWVEVETDDLPGVPAHSWVFAATGGWGATCYRPEDYGFEDCAAMKAAWPWAICCNEDEPYHSRTWCWWIGVPNGTIGRATGEPFPTWCLDGWEPLTFQGETAACLETVVPITRCYDYALPAHMQIYLSGIAGKAWACKWYPWNSYHCGSPMDLALLNGPITLSRAAASGEWETCCFRTGYVIPSDFEGDVGWLEHWPWPWLIGNCDCDGWPKWKDLKFWFDLCFAVQEREDGKYWYGVLTAYIEQWGYEVYAPAYALEIGWSYCLRWTFAFKPTNQTTMQIVPGVQSESVELNTSNYCGGQPTAGGTATIVAVRPPAWPPG